MQKNRLFLSVIALLFSLSMVWAETTPDFDNLFDDMDQTIAAGSEKSTGTVKSNAITIKGEQTVEYHLPVRPGYWDYSSYLRSPKLMNELDMTYEKDEVKLVSNWDMELLLVSGDGDINTLGVIPQENFIAWNSGAVKLGFGYQSFEWGSADKLNPTNNLNPKDYARNIFEFENIPVLSLAATLYPWDDISLDVVWIPYDAAYVFPKNSEIEIPEILFPAGAVQKSSLATNLNSGVAGFLLRYYSAMDVSLSYVYDFDAMDTPVIWYQDFMNKSMTLVRNRIHRFGMDMKTTIGRAALWLEACYSMTEDAAMETYAQRNPDLAWTVGSDFSLGKSNQVYCNIQYTGRYVFDFDDQFYTDYPGAAFDPIRVYDSAYMLEYYYRLLTQKFGDQNEAMLHGLAFKTEWKLLDEKIIPSLAGAVYLPQQYDEAEKERLGSMMLNPEIRLAPINNLEFRLGAVWAYAWQRLPGQDEVTLDQLDRLGRLNEDNNIYLEVQYVWGAML